jgi:DNA polymerase I-like protein with 3'-5' exonuclease and polymerase domains
MSVFIVSGRKTKYPFNKDYEQKSLHDFWTWFNDQDQYQLDIETNKVVDITLRKIYVVQFGSVYEDIQWVLDVASFPEDAITFVKKCLDDRSKRKLIFFAQFEYSTIRICWGIDIANIYDIHLVMKLILNGKYVEDGIFSLAGAIKEYLKIDLSKEEQTSFKGTTLSYKQIMYAANDVKYLQALKEHLESLEEYEHHKEVIYLENEVVRAFGDCVTNGFDFDEDTWLENIVWVEPYINEAREKVFDYIRNDFRTECEMMGMIQPEDEVDINWNSITQKAEILSVLYPSLKNFKKQALVLFEKTLPTGNLISKILNKEYEEVNSILKKKWPNLLQETGHLRKAGDILLNLNSPKQRLELFRLVIPELPNTANDELVKHDHQMIKDYLEYIGKDKLRSSYGENWLEYIDSDGKIRPRMIQQIVHTGRISVKPALQTIPADDYYIFDRYRQAFRPGRPGWKFSAVDYKSQELAVIAYMTGELAWIEALLEGKDLHSVSAAMIFKQKWIEAGGDPDGWKKPTTKDGKRLRTFAKTISFLLAYGGGAFTLAKRLQIPTTLADELIEQYFGTFQDIKAGMDYRGEFAVENGYITTLPPFNRRRYFGEWFSGSLTEKARGAIDRRGRNTPIQGSSADQTKAAMVMIKSYIERNWIADCVEINFQLHDATLTQFDPIQIPEWPKIHCTLMEEAAEINVPGGLIKGDSSVTDYWTK